ncbi:MAG: tRNA (adenosine(37)-N6)-dimethylallyltransferase MiaA [Alphaproteobacteria bacterium]|nr:tRNA (adenosine(37)-N6)-dimethylallyltransferase MiaA [Alphaproteobacteria bacterium]
MKTRDYIIVGPTASGKSGFADRLARRINGVIINCDSVQIYRGIENISASPFAENLEQIATQTLNGVPYKLFSVLDLSTQQSVSDYLKMAQHEYDIAKQAGRPVIFVGGTGYYANALLNGISQIPNVDDESRRRARELVAHDINAARKMLPADFRYTDAQRVARALEVFFQTGHHITEYQKNARVGAVLPNDTVKILINPDAKILRERIAGRIPEMLSGGAIDEARAIIQNNWNPSRAIGAVQLVDFLNGKTDRDTAIQNWITKTNQYAKRQRTWFRTQFSPDIVFDHVPTDADTELVLQY